MQEKLFRKASEGIETNEAKLQKILDESPAVIKREELLPFLDDLKVDEAG